MHRTFSCFVFVCGFALAGCVNGVEVGQDDGALSSSASSSSSSSASSSSSSSGGGGGDGGSTSSSGGGPEGALCADVETPPSSCPVNNYHDPLVSFVAASSFIFKGKVTALHETTAGIDMPDTTHTVVVEVEEPLYDPSMIASASPLVTVVLLEEPTMDVGYEGYFFSQLWTEGVSVGVTEVALVDPGVYPSLDADVPGIEALLAERALYSRMNTAASVVVATVTAVDPLPRVGPASEHEPDWARATLAVACTLRGTPLANAEVAFATSTDVAWFRSPKLAAGDAAVLLLQPVPSPPGAWPVGEGVPYVVTDALDVQAADARADVATLVWCAPD